MSYQEKRKIFNLVRITIQLYIHNTQGTFTKADHILATVSYINHVTKIFWSQCSKTRN